MISDSVKHYSQRLFLYFLIVASASLCATITGRLEPLITVAPFAAAILIALFSEKVPNIRTGYNVSHSTVNEHSAVDVQIEICSETDVGILELNDWLPPSAKLVQGSNRVVVPLYAGSTKHFQYQVLFQRRDRINLGQIQQHLHDESALVRWEQIIPPSHKLAVRPYTPPVTHQIQPRRTQVYIGNYPAPHSGDGLEARELRVHAQGDRVRNINWRASLRMGQLHVNDYTPERNTDVVFLLDTFSDAGLPGSSLLDSATRIIASLAEHFLSNRNRVGLIELSGVLKWLIPAAGRRQLFELYERLTDVAARKSYAGQDLRTIPTRILPTRSFVIAISGLVDDRFAFAINDLNARGFNVSLIYLDAATTAFEHANNEKTKTKYSRSLNMAAATLWRAELRERRFKLENASIPIVDADSMASTELIARALDHLQRSGNRQWTQMG